MLRKHLEFPLAQSDDRPTVDRFDEIKALATEAPYRGDPNFAWLIAEVERLRVADTALRAIVDAVFERGTRPTTDTAWCFWCGQHDGLEHNPDICVWAAAAALQEPDKFRNLPTSRFKDLRRLALAATRGPWEAWFDNDGGRTWNVLVPGSERVTQRVMAMLPADSEADARFIAACTPDLILGLLGVRVLGDTDREATSE
jgi:hypothetical protein